MEGGLFGLLLLLLLLLLLHIYGTFPKLIQATNMYFHKTVEYWKLLQNKMGQIRKNISSYIAWDKKLSNENRGGLKGENLN